MRNLFSIMSNLQTHYHFKLDFQKVGKHTAGRWLFLGTKRHKDNQLQSLKLPYRTKLTFNKPEIENKIWWRNNCCEWIPTILQDS